MLIFKKRILKAYDLQGLKTLIFVVDLCLLELEFTFFFFLVRLTSFYWTEMSWVHLEIILNLQFVPKSVLHTSHSH